VDLVSLTGTTAYWNSLRFNFVWNCKNKVHKIKHNVWGIPSATDSLVLKKMRVNNICQYCTKENQFGEYYFGPWGSNVISTLNFTVQQWREPAGISQAVWAGQRKNMVRFPERSNIFPLLQSVETRLWGPPSFLFKRYEWCFRGTKAAGAWS